MMVAAPSSRAAITALSPTDPTPKTANLLQRFKMLVDVKSAPLAKKQSLIVPFAIYTSENIQERV